MYLLIISVLVVLSIIGAISYYIYTREKVYSINSCQDFDLKLECPEGQVASKGIIKYGRWDNTICQNSTVNLDTPPKYEIFSIKPGQVSVRDSISVDPYPGVYKHFDIQYTCDKPEVIDTQKEQIKKESSPKCIADNTWSNTKPVSYGDTVTRKCLSGGVETATCGEKGSWTMSGCPQVCIPDSTWGNNGPIPVGGKVTRKCKDGKNQEATCLKNGELSISVCDPVPEDCIVTDWSTCNLDTMTQTRTKITEDKYGGFCPSLVQQCSSYIRSTYPPKCPTSTQQIGANCYKFPTGEITITGTDYVPKCPNDTDTVGNDCKKTIIGYNPKICKEGKLSGNTCVLNQYDRGNVYVSSGIVGLGGTSGVTLCNKAHNGNCESSRINRNDGYPKCATGYQVSLGSERTCVPIGANPGGVREIGLATCNPGDYTATNINACFSQPLPGYIREEAYRDTIGNPFVIDKLVQKPLTADKIEATCNHGDSYAQGGSCFPQPKEGYTCSGNECKLKG